MRKIRPLGQRVLLQLVAPDAVTKGGIIIPDNAKERPQIATVLAVGPGKLLDDGTYRPVGMGTEGQEWGVGDKVLFLKYAGAESELQGPEREPWRIVHESDIIAVYDRG